MERAGISAVGARVHQHFGRAAAIPNLEDRFIVEAQAVNAIRDPHIVEITDILESADGHPIALVMELLEGESLCEVMTGDRKLTMDRVLRILAHVCEALAAAHA